VVACEGVGERIGGLRVEDDFGRASGARGEEDEGGGGGC